MAARDSSYVGNRCPPARYPVDALSSFDPCPHVQAQEEKRLPLAAVRRRFSRRSAYQAKTMGEVAYDFFNLRLAVAECPNAQSGDAPRSRSQDDPKGSRSPFARPNPLEAEFGIEIQCLRQNRRTDSAMLHAKIGNDLGFQASSRPIQPGVAGCCSSNCMTSHTEPSLDPVEAPIMVFMFFFSGF